MRKGFALFISFCHIISYLCACKKESEPNARVKTRNSQRDFLLTIGRRKTNEIPPDQRTDLVHARFEKSLCI